MLFCTQPFLYFFLGVFAVYWLTPWPRARVYILVAASFFFYWKFNQYLALLVTGTATLDFLLALAISKARSRLEGRLLVAVSLVVNLAVLIYFKYANFFLDSLAQALRELGAERSLPVLQVILPVGISFYTFEAISYTIDVYRGRAKAENNLANFLLFILFFPHLVAGPIVRAYDFLPQVARRKRWSWVKFTVGGRLILLGMVKKMVIADRMALIVDPVFENPAAFNSATIWMATIAYAIQLYCDFSGYSDIALGTARMLGYRLVVNFNMPYSAANMTELWRRWHISLSTWIRDYVYIPLGGNRGSVLRTNFNLLAAMTLCGLWHGASWTFVAWGAMHGGFLIVHRVFRSAVGRIPLLETIPGTILRVAITFLAFALAAVLFRAPTFEIATAVYKRLAIPGAGYNSPVPAANLEFGVGVGLMLIGHILGRWPRTWAIWNRVPPPVRGLAFAVALFFVFLLPPANSKMFIYFQF